MNPPLTTRMRGVEQLFTLTYELLDAHRDTLELADDFADVSWQAHLDYLRALHRRGKELLATALAHDPFQRPGTTR